MSLVFGTFGGAFVPTSITGLVLWVKADSLALSDGDPVSTGQTHLRRGTTLHKPRERISQPIKQRLSMESQ